MQGTPVSVVGNAAAVELVDGSNGAQGRPVRATVHPRTGTVYLGGPNVDATHGYGLASTDPPITVELIADSLWAFTSTTAVVDVLISGA